MANEKTNKVVLGSEVLIDITDTTATADKVLTGYDFYGADGVKRTGTAEAGGETIIVVNYSDEFRGLTISCTKSGSTTTKVAPIDKNQVRFYPTETGEYTISVTYEGQLYSTTATILEIGDIVECALEYLVDGKTVLPTDSVEIWLKCAKLEYKGYTTLAEVLNDIDTYEALLSDSNACDYMVRSTTWADKGEGQVPTMTSDTTPSGTVTYSRQYSSNYIGYRAFNPSEQYGWLAYSTNPYVAVGDWIGYEFTEAIEIKSVSALFVYEGQVTTVSGKIQGYDGANWVDLSDEYEIASNVSNIPTLIDLSENADEYIKYRWICTVVPSNNHNYGLKFQFYPNEIGITENADAMRILGKYNYACYVLLADETWAKAIAKSDYFESVLTASVPKMTSYTTPEGEVSASTYYSNYYYPYQAFNGVWLGRGWCPSASDAQRYVQYKFTEPVTIYALKYNVYYDSTLASTYGFKISGSNDGTNWTDIGTGYTISKSNEIYTNIIDTPSAYLYYRFTLTSSTSGGYTTNSGFNLQFYGRPSAKLIPLVPTMTSNTTPSGEASADSANSDAWKVFDGTTGQWMASSSGYHWIKYEFPNAVKAIKAYAETSSAYYPSRFSKFQVQASNDDITYVDLMDEETLSTYTITANFTKNIDKYKYYKFIIYGASEALIDNIQLYAQEPTVDLIHSAPYDTVYYIEDGNPVVITTTNVNGVGEVDWSDLPLGEVTLYSSVANDPNNLANPYAKSIIVTPNKVEAILMPKGALYWWGWKSPYFTLEVNGWGIPMPAHPVYDVQIPTENTNSVTIVGGAGAGWRSGGVYNLPYDSFDSVYFIIDYSTADSSALKYIVQVGNTNIYKSTTMSATGLHKETIDKTASGSGTLSGDVGVAVCTRYSTITMYAVVAG